MYIYIYIYKNDSWEHALLPVRHGTPHTPNKATLPAGKRILNNPRPIGRRACLLPMGVRHETGRCTFGYRRRSVHHSASGEEDNISALDGDGKPLAFLLQLLQLLVVQLTVASIELEFT